MKLLTRPRTELIPVMNCNLISNTGSYGCVLMKTAQVDGENGVMKGYIRLDNRNDIVAIVTTSMKQFQISPEFISIYNEPRTYSERFKTSNLKIEMKTIFYSNYNHKQIQHSQL